jgi:hypothetical protein
MPKLRYHGPVGGSKIMSTERESLTAEEDNTENAENAAEEACASTTLRVITWLSVGMAVATIGIFLGRELRSRYKFKRRTPYDFYSHAGEQPSEFGVGI